MSSFLLRPVLAALLLLAGAIGTWAGVTTYTDRGKTDFDTALRELNPYGTWSKIDGAWAYTPLDHGAPYTDGRWLYTEYGWYWKGNRPHGWATEHYGFWKRGAGKVWAWYPGPYWLPETVELRATDSHLGWRSGEVNRDGEFVEKPLDRYAKTDEWTFVTRAQFAQPITPAILATPEVTKAQLEDSTDSRHTYLTYREIDRPGPHPADFPNGATSGMLAPRTLEDDLAPPPAPAAAPVPGVSAMTGTNAPVLIGGETSAAADQRKVKYWITMSLPTYWSKPPPEAKATEIYLYRPDFYQDEDGIARRITLWFNPKSRTSLKELLTEKLPGVKPDAGPGAPSQPSVPAPSHGAFQSPFDDEYRPSASSKNPSPPPARDDSAPIPSPFLHTNAAPVDPKPR